MPFSADQPSRRSQGRRRDAGATAPLTRAERRRRRRLPHLSRHQLLARAGIALSVLLLAVVGVWHLRGPLSNALSTTQDRAAVPAEGNQAAGATSPTASATPSALARELSDVDALLAQRATAIATKDRALFEETIADVSSAEGKALAAQFDAVTALSPQEVRYAPAASITPQGRAERGDLVVRSEVTYRIPGVDAGPARSTERFAITRTAAGVRLLASQVTGGDEHGIPIWALPGVTIAKGPHGLVAGAVAAEQAQRYLEMAATAVTQVEAVWQRPWPEKIVVILPKDQTQLRALVGGSGGEDYGQVAAMTLGPLDADGRARADRIIINPTPWAELSATGRQFVLTHESTHVAVRASHPGRAPMWLTEGLADYVGYLPLGSRPAEVSPELMTAVREGKGPTALPNAGDFTSADTPLAPTYAASWFAVRHLFEKYGKQTALGFYAASTAPVHAPGGEQPSPAEAEAAADKAFKRVLRESRDAFTEEWLSALRQAAGSG